MTKPWNRIAKGMSSTTTDAAAAATTTTAMERQTYWCYECDTSVSLLPPSPLLCPHCCSDFLERLDTPLPNPNSSPDPNLSQFPISIDPPPLSPPHQTPTATTPPSSNDNYLLESPYLRRLIQQIANSDSENPSPFLATSSPCLLAPASKAAVEALPTIKITDSLLELDPILLCAVCKDPFAIDDEAKQLPCKHMYHPCCILPWLSQHNSCPVCRFRLPTENNESTETRRRISSGLIAGRRRRRSGLTAAMLRDLMMERTGSTLTDVARRQEQSGVEESSQLSPTTQVGEAEAGLVEHSSSVETVSSWLFEGGANASDGAGGNGNIVES